MNMDTQNYNKPLHALNMLNVCSPILFTQYSVFMFIMFVFCFVNWTPICNSDCFFPGVAVDGSNGNEGDSCNIHLVKRKGKVKALEEEITGWYLSGQSSSLKLAFLLFSISTK